MDTASFEVAHSVVEVDIKTFISLYLTSVVNSEIKEKKK